MVGAAAAGGGLFVAGKPVEARALAARVLRAWSQVEGQVTDSRRREQLAMLYAYARQEAQQGIDGEATKSLILQTREIRYGVVPRSRWR